MPMYQRPPFWRVPHQRMDPEDEPVRDFGQRKVKVTPGTPAGKDLVRGDIIAKIDDYDARDLRHEDAQNLFKNASNQIKLVVQRGGSSCHLYSVPRASGSYVGRVPTPTFYHEYAQSYKTHRFIRGDVDREGARSGTPLAPRSPIPNAAAAPYRTQSPLPAHAWKGPESLPRSTPVPSHLSPQYTPFPHQIDGDYRALMLSPNSIRTDESIDESLGSQPYRTTPLVLPGAKVRREPGPTESYLRHHPNPAMRAPPHHDYRDTLMRQKVVHKQFNSPIGLYSDQNIANSIRQQTSPLPLMCISLYCVAPANRLKTNVPPRYRARCRARYRPCRAATGRPWRTTPPSRTPSARCRRTGWPTETCCARCPRRCSRRSSRRRPIRGQRLLRNRRSSPMRNRKENKRPS